MSVALEAARGEVTYRELPEGGGEVSVVTGDGSSIARPSCRTTYPAEIVQRVLDIKGAEYLCDELDREEDPMYVRHELTYGLLGFAPVEWFAGKRVLDFGSGSGSSTIVLRDLLPGAHLVGIELERDYVDLARDRAAFRGIDDVEFHLSPSPDELPAGIGEFDAVILSAVYEHLLPGERTPLLRLLWGSLRPGGYLFVNQLPHRWFPYEHHTTSLWGVGYLPASLAGPVSRRFSRRGLEGCDWPTLLRMGIRGGTQRDIRRRLESLGAGAPTVVDPIWPGTRDHADLWLAYSTERAASWKKRLAHRAFKLAERVGRQPFNQSVMTAFRKRDS